LIADHPEKAKSLKANLNKWASGLKYPGLEMEMKK
jgi:hypothetical protein